MRIMIINTYYYPEIVGGAEYSVKKLAEKLVWEGHTVRVLCTGKEYCKEVIDGVEVIRVKDGVVVKTADAPNANAFVKLHRWLQELWCVANKDILLKELDDFKPEVIHTNGLYDISPIIWKLAKNRGIRVVHTLRDYFLMCPRVSLTCSRTSSTCQNPTILCKLYRSVNRKHTKYVDAITAPSLVVLDTLKEDGYFKKSLGKVVPNATEYDEKTVLDICQARQKLLPAAPRFVYLGSLIRVKGVEWLIQCFRKLPNPDVELYIAGKGELEDYVKSAAAEDKRIHFVGFLDEKGVSDLLKKTDVLVAPSLWEEPFGRIVLDAYKHAMPVIVSVHGALPTLVSEGKNGIIVDDKISDDLKNAMEYFIKNPGKVAEFSRHSVKELKRFSLDVQYQLFISIYQI